MTRCDTTPVVPGMDWWRILVLVTLKQGLNSDYDRLAELANEHGTLRKMLGHGIMPHDYNRQTVADNVRLLTPQLLDEISRLVVCEGHQAAGKEPDAALHGRADSFWKNSADALKQSVIIAVQ